MSYLFEHRDEAVWEPSLDVAGLLLSTIGHLESRLGIKSGLDVYMSDTVDVRFDQLHRFLVALREWASLENTSLALLLRPVFVHLMSLLYCGDPSAAEVERGLPPPWIQEARDLAQANMRRVEEPVLAAQGTDRT
jgi:hypothetical protein